MIVYLATNKINGKKYVGITTKMLEERKSQHEYTANYKPKCYFHKALVKYGFDNFSWEVIDEVDDIEELKLREIYWIAYYDSFENGYNLTRGGEGVFGLEHSEETKLKLAEAQKGKMHSEEAKRKISEALKGSKNPLTKITEAEVVEIKQMLIDGIEHKKIAEKFDVDVDLIKKISNNSNWKHVKVEGWDDWLASKKTKAKPLSNLQVIEVKNLLMLGFPPKIVAKMLNIPRHTILNISCGRKGNRVHVEGWDEFIASKKKKKGS